MSNIKNRESINASIQLLRELVAPIEYLLVDERRFVYAAIFDTKLAAEHAMHGFTLAKDAESNRIGKASDEQIAIFRTIEILRKELQNAD
jgi:hypothetical protein